MKSDYRLIRLGIMMILGTAILEIPFTSFSHALAQDIEEEASIQVYQRTAPAVVSIQTADTIGGGIIISPDGLLLTAAKVVQNFQTVTVTLADGRNFQADVVGFGEAGTDLAAIQILDQTNLPTISLARPDSIAVGLRTFVIGNPFGQFQGTFTLGIISRIDEEQGLIQTDAAINPGDIGGPLLNRSRKLIGVTTSTFNPQQVTGSNGIGFAGSISQIEPFLIAVREGRASRVAQNPLLQSAQPITPDDSPVSGELTPTSNVLRTDNSYFNSYTFEGKAGQQIMIEMISRDFDAFLILIVPNATDAIQDDNSGGGTNAQIMATLPVDGTYIILANSYAPEATGRYSISVMIESAVSQF